MRQIDLERFAFLYLCGPRDRNILKKETRMTFMDFERLTYLTGFFGLAAYNLDIWNRFAKQFEGQFDALAEMHNEGVLEEDGETSLGEREAEGQQQEIWVRDFYRLAPDKALREWLEEEAMAIYRKQGIESFWKADVP